jgi:hypothetical protein
MKMTTRKFLLLATAALTAGLATGHGQIVLVNVSNPAAVTFTGTGDFALADYTGTVGGDAFPVRLSGFFTSNQANFDALAASTSLMTTGADHTLGRAFLRVGAGGPTTLLLRRDGNSQENFSTSSAAFTGTATFDLSSFASALPAVGASGNIYAADGLTLVGTYSVTAVPEPAECALVFGIVALSLAALKRHRTTDNDR